MFSLFTFMVGLSKYVCILKDPRLALQFGKGYGAWGGVLALESGNLFEKGSRLRGKLRRYPHDDLDIQVAGTAVCGRHPLVPDPKKLAVLRTGRNLELHLLLVKGGDGDLCAENRLRHRDRNRAIEIGARTLKAWVRLDADKDIEIPVRPAARTGVALARNRDSLAILNPGRDRDEYLLPLLQET